MKSKLVVAGAVFASVFMFPAAAWASVAFAPAVNYPVGTISDSVAVGDVNGDGDLDLATVGGNIDVVNILLGNGDGTFAAANSYGVVDSPRSVALGDVNGDGDLDVATANGGNNTASVLLGNGDGTFAAATGYPVGVFPRAVALGDVNGDGDLDLATANGASDNVSVLLGNGDGTFAAATQHGVSDDPRAVAIGDLNGDGKLDLATANRGSNNVSILLGNGDGTFAAAASHPTGASPRSVAIDDLNGDGDPDLAVANELGASASVLLGQGDGTFTTAASPGISDIPASVAVGDLDGDNVPDLVVDKPNEDYVSVLVGNGDGTFAAATNHGFIDGPVAVAIGDFNNDSKPDLATPDATGVSVLLNTTSTFTTGPTASISGTVRQGQTLTADEGAPDPVPDSFTYKWFADGVAIGGATAKTFELTSAEEGKKIKVTVTAKEAGFTDASDTSPETVPVEGIFTPGPTASISGLRRVGSTLTANTGSPSPTPDSFAYRWFLDGQQLGTKTKTLKLGAGTAGKPIRVKVYAIKAGYLTAADLSPATAPISNLQAKTISMELNDYTVVRGQRVYAEIELLAPNEPFTIVLDGTKLASGYANTKGVAVKAFTVPANATTGARILRAYGKFTDRTDPDPITIR